MGKNTNKNLDSVKSSWERYSSAQAEWKAYYEVAEAWHNGNHWQTEYDNRTNSLVSYPVYLHRGPRLVWPLVGRTNNIIASLFTQSLPTWTATAANMEGMEETIAARSATGFLQNNTRKQGWGDQIMKSLRGMVVLGSYAAGVYWNNNKGPKFLNSKNKNKERIGLPDVRAIHPGQLYLPSGWIDPDISKAPEIIVEHVLLTEDIWRDYGVEVEPEGDLIPNRNGRWTIDKIKNREYGSDKTPEIHQSALVLECWKRPSKKHPKGMFTICTRDKILAQTDELPYEFCLEYNMLPFAWLNYENPRESLRGLAATDVLRSVNFYLNILMSNLTIGATRTSIPKMMLPANSAVDPEAWRNPDKALIYSHMAKVLPQYLNSPGESKEAAAVIAEYFMWAEKGVGATETLQGVNPDAVRGVAHLMGLQETAMKSFDHTKQNVRQFIARIGQMLLWLLAEKMPMDLGLEMFGQLGTAGWKILKERAFQSDFNVDVQEDTLIYQLPIVKRQQIVEDFGMGLYGDPTDPKALAKVRQALGLSNKDELTRQEEINRNIAENENLTIKAIAQNILPRTKIPVPDPADDYDLHMDCHNMMRLELHNEVSMNDLNNKDSAWQESALQLLEIHQSQHQQLAFGQQQPMSNEEIAAQNGGMAYPEMGGQVPPEAMPAEQNMMPLTPEMSLPQEPSLELGGMEMGAMGGLPPEMEQ